MEYKIIKYLDNKNSFYKLFEELKTQFKYINSLYSNDFIECFKLKMIYDDYEVEDLSYILTYKNKPFSAFIGSKFSKSNQSQLGTINIPVLIIDIEKTTNKQNKFIIESFNSVCSNNFKKAYLSGPECSINIPILCDYLLSKKSATIISYPTRCINLDSSEEYLKTLIRKSYKSLINWGLKNMKIEIFDQKNINWEQINLFRELHLLESGKETRSIESWEKLFKSIKNGDAFFIVAKINKEIVSAAIFLCSNFHCYYCSAASKRNLFDKGISHAIIWKAILKAKALGAHIFETGICNIDSLKSCKTQKEKNISYFKKGFGGKLIIKNIVKVNN